MKGIILYGAFHARLFDARTSLTPTLTLSRAFLNSQGGAEPPEDADHGAQAVVHQLVPERAVPDCAAPRRCGAPGGRGQRRQGRRCHCCGCRCRCRPACRWCRPRNTRPPQHCPQEVKQVSMGGGGSSLRAEKGRGVCRCIVEERDNGYHRDRLQRRA